MAKTAGKGLISPTRYETPQAFVRQCRELVGMPFKVDLAAEDKTAKAALYYGPDHVDVFRRNLFAASRMTIAREACGGACWCNPPYGRRITACPPECEPLNCKRKRKMCMQSGVRIETEVPGIATWIEYIAELTRDNATICGLLPSNARDTEWWHQVATTAHAIHDVRGRLHFLMDGVAQTSPDFNNVVAVWRPGPPSTGRAVLGQPLFARPPS